MKSIKILIICVLSVFLAGKTLAQSNTENIAIWKQFIIDKNSIIDNTSTKDKDKLSPLIEVRKYQDNIINHQDSIINILTNLSSKNASDRSQCEMRLNYLQKKYEIDEFLDNQDVTIFTTEFRTFSKINRRSNDYLLVQKIHYVDSILKIIEQKAKTVETEREYLKTKFSINDEAKLNENLKNLKEYKEIINHVEEANKKMDEIEAMDIYNSFLSERQKQYYKPFLVDKYNGYFDKFYTQ